MLVKLRFCLALPTAILFWGCTAPDASPELATRTDPLTPQGPASGTTQTTAIARGGTPSVSPGAARAAYAPFEDNPAHANPTPIDPNAKVVQLPTSKSETEWGRKEVARIRIEKEKAAIPADQVGITAHPIADPELVKRQDAYLAEWQSRVAEISAIQSLDQRAELLARTKARHYGTGGAR